MNRNPRPGHQIARIALFCVTLPAIAAAQEAVKVPKDPYGAVLALEAQAAVADGHPVAVMDVEGEPCAGVSVIVVDTEVTTRAMRRAELRAAAKMFPGDAEASQLALFALHGKRYVTDAKGEAKFAPVPRGMVLAVRARVLAVANVARRSGGEPRAIRLTLKPKAGIDVVVVDHRGRAVQGVKVGLVWRGEYSSSSTNSDKTTGADGRARLAGFGWNRGVNLVPYVEAKMVSAKRISVALDPKTFVNDPAKPVQLKLPPFGMVRVYIVDDNQRPVNGVDAVYLQSTRVSADREVFMAAELKGDTALFPCVEVGMKFEVWCQFKGTTRPQRVRSDGPRHPMDMRVVTLAGITAPKTITFRLLDQKGEPVANETVGVIFAIPSRFEAKTTTTNPAGECSVQLSEQVARGEEGYLTITRRGTGSRLVYRGAARVSIEKFSKSPNLGDLRLVDEKLLVSGQVVDKNGEPVGGVHITTPNHYRATDRGSGSSSGDPKVHSHTTTTDKEGRFEFRELAADPAGVKLALENWRQGKKDRYIISGGDAVPGARDHRVVVGFTSTIAGSFKGVPVGERFQGQVDIQDKDGGRVENLWVNLGPDGGFTVNRCPPGDYRLQFKLPSAAAPFLTIDKIHVEADKPCVDPRLRGIDLTKHCKFIKVTVLRPDKTPAPPLTIWTLSVKDGRATGASGRSTNGMGVLQMCVPIEGGNLAVIPPDGLYRPREFENQKDDLTVTLVPGWPTKIRFKNMPKLPASLHYTTSLTATGPAARTQWGMSLGTSRSRSAIDEKGELELWVGTPGMQRLTLSPRFGASGQRLTGPSLTGPSLTGKANSLRFEVEVKKDAKGVQVFDLELDEGSLEMIKAHIEAAKENEKGK